ncbi:hypothetical protein J5N97_027321 [Dioscorea zingiberensis]|uniref:Endonuclease/exonuclease/phosphatase domain-containing protein n=1 Tax=Dioscorea zingiberensis TaxID=325984 RepID=A0A9D5H7J6_9LILI|nr:hypothetical protein J5N97_027321 [Dioscorea zingiberensis]
MGNAKSSSETPRREYDDDESSRRWWLRRPAEKETDEGKSSTQFSLAFKVGAATAGVAVGGVIGGLLALCTLCLVSSLRSPKLKAQDDDEDESIRQSLRRQEKKETGERKSSTQFSLALKVGAAMVGAMAGGVIGGLLALGALRLASSLRSPKLKAHDDESIRRQSFHQHIKKEIEGENEDESLRRQSLHQQNKKKIEGENDDESIRLRPSHQQIKKEIEGENDDEHIRGRSLHQQTKKKIKGENDDESIRRPSFHQQTKKEIEGENDDKSIRRPSFHQQTKKEIEGENDDESIRRRSLHQPTEKEIEGENDDESIRQMSLHQQTKKEIKGESLTQFSSVLEVLEAHVMRDVSKSKKDSQMLQNSHYILQDAIPPLEFVTPRYNFTFRVRLHWSQIKIMSYNVWCREDVEVKKRMKVIGNLVKQYSPDIIFFQEVTPNIYKLFERSNWWQLYNPSVLSAAGRAPFCMLLSKLSVELFTSIPFSNSMEKELCVGEIDVGLDKKLIVATSHLKCQTLEMTNSEERVSQAEEALRYLQQFPNVIFGGDMNWDEDEDGVFPLQGGWTDAWAELKRKPGWTFDTKSNKMLKGHKPLQKRLDRFICKLEEDFRITNIEMIGKKAIPGSAYCNDKGMVLPVFPSDHYGLILTISIFINIDV